ncbi:transcriptional repressor TraM [Rhizobium sp. PL01]|uniref:transcriptional repressor TraM n=1 Tax=Rhizobium sp. PL01 TaxID=3085631 RepID=UPI002982A7D6|nr:transcriptional repressor TraM [Rhizobium sp. PL01]MDW5318326.1 transcriptional repressor TraM [Rhizobium sp. PL01]
MTDKNTNARISESKIVLRPVLGLVEGLDPSQLRDVTIDAILKHRILRDEASQAHRVLENVQSAQSRPEEIRFAERGYIAAMIAMHAHQTALSTLLDVLGYVPEVPPQQPSN